jgi:hypothetical protein
LATKETKPLAADIAVIATDSDALRRIHYRVGGTAPKA